MAHEDTFEGKDIIIVSFLNSIQYVLFSCKHKQEDESYHPTISGEL